MWDAITHSYPNSSSDLTVNVMAWTVSYSPLFDMDTISYT